MTEVRKIRVRREGFEHFKRWVRALREAEQRGETVPDVRDFGAVASWLDARGLIVRPVTRDQAKLLIEACLEGGEVEVRAS
jgi:hypothetical protein